ncbi:MAG: hypothetical protein HUU46_25230 [Candidatus Hydrogenedentes bacterium]|nr:hypothetical protein [Candidatus Hydrogenedentota bacterium]
MAREVRNRHAARACVFAACACFLFGLTAAAEGKVELEVEDAGGFAGGQVTVNVRMEADPRPSAIAFWLEYDTNNLTFVDAYPGAVVTLAGKDVSWDFPEPGRISFLIFGLNDLRIASGIILSITFAIDDDAQPNDEFDLIGLNYSATGPNAEPIRTEFDNGEIDVLQCFEPAAPTSFVATDGIFGDHIQLSWLPVFGAQSYTILRSTINDPGTGTVIAVTVLPFYSDFSAQGPSFVSTGGGGCGGTTGQSLRYTEYYYWVRAQNICGQSAYTAAESGWRGKSGDAAKAGVTPDALPASVDETTTQFALRLSGGSDILPESIDGSVDSESIAIDSIEWRPAADSNAEGWAIVTLSSPLAADVSITIRVSARNSNGETVDATHTFACDGPLDVAPESTNAKSADEIVVVQAVAPGVPDFVASMGPRYAVSPALPFASPQRVAIPVPDGVEPGEMAPHLYVAGAGWCPAPFVDGWVVPGSLSVADVDGVSCVTFDANYGGLVQLGYLAPPAVPAPSNWAGGLPMAIAVLAILAASALRRSHPTVK